MSQRRTLTLKNKFIITKYFEINNKRCYNGFSKICINQLHYFFYKKNYYSFIKKLLEDNLNNINIYKNKKKDTLQQFLNNLYDRATNIPANIAFDFTFPKKILKSIKKILKNAEYIIQ